MSTDRSQDRDLPINVSSHHERVILAATHGFHAVLVKVHGLASDCDTVVGDAVWGAVDVGDGSENEYEQ